MSSSVSGAAKGVLKAAMKSPSLKKGSNKASVATRSVGGAAAKASGTSSAVGKNSSSRLPAGDKKQLTDSLYFLHVPELRSLLADTLKISDKGTKKLLVQRIVQYLDTQQVLTKPAFPFGVTAAAFGEKIASTTPTSPDHVMVQGIYKNDLLHREYFQTLIGADFHFTARGLDWLEEKWLSGKTPTYGEFARYWKESADAGHLNKDTLQYNQFQVKHKGQTAAWITAEWEKLRAAEKKKAVGLVQKWKW